jgi:hypothetical protein
MVDNIKLDFKEMAWTKVYFAENRDQWRALVKTAMNLRIL